MRNWVRRITSHISMLIIQEDVAIYSFDPVDLMAGSLPRRQQRLVMAWAELHQAELLADWERLQAGRSPLPIEPLK
jgi:hypothetical protein